MSSELVLRILDRRSERADCKRSAFRFSDRFATPAIVKPRRAAAFDPTKLNLGSGGRLIDDALNVDIVAGVNPDITHESEQASLPLPNNQFIEVFAYDVIETSRCRDCDDGGDSSSVAPGAVVKITVPHFSCANAYIDPTHRHQFGWSSFHYLTGEHEFSFYFSSRYRRRVSQIVFAQTLVNKIVRRVANRFPEAYERRWAWMFPAWFLYFELEVLKERQDEDSAN